MPMYFLRGIGIRSGRPFPSPPPRPATSYLFPSQSVCVIERERDRLPTVWGACISILRL